MPDDVLYLLYKYIYQVPNSEFRYHFLPGQQR